MDQQIRVKLVVDSADQALAWYGRVLGAEPGERHEIEGRVVFAQFEAHGTTLTIKDADDHDRVAAGLILEVVVEDADRVWKAAVDAGAEVVFPLDDQFYGKRSGRFRDPFGVQWIVTGPLGS
jgi:PhnB protein